jgi:hypothetical protein
MKLLISSLSILTFAQLSFGQTSVFLFDPQEYPNSQEFLDDKFEDSLFYAELGLYDEFYEDPEKTMIESFQELSMEDQITYFKSGGNPNEKYTTKNGNYIVFRSLAHAYGFWGSNEDKELVFAMIEAATEPIEDPFFFMEDPNFERRKDVLEYFVHINTHNQVLDEAKFSEVRSMYLHSNEGTNFISDEGKHVLIYASQLNYLNQVKAVIKGTNDVNHIDNSGKTALDYAFENKNLDIMKVLLENGANPSLKQANGSTLLIESCKNDDLETALLLLDFGANASATDDENLSALKACKSKGTKRAIKSKIKKLRKKQ